MIIKFLNKNIFFPIPISINLDYENQSRFGEATRDIIVVNIKSKMTDGYCIETKKWLSLSIIIDYSNLHRVRIYFFFAFLCWIC